MNTPVENLIGKFGTQQALAEAAGVSQPTVAGWKISGFIPARRQPIILAAARDLDIPLTPADFFPVAA